MTIPLVKIHRFLAIFLGLFIAQHLGIHLLAIIGINFHLVTLATVGVIYKNWLVEPILVFAIIAQIVLGLNFVKKRWKEPSKGFWAWVQILSGCYLTFFLLMHTSAALITRYQIGLETNFYWAAGTLHLAPVKYFFAPYYFLAIFSIFAHIAAALSFRMKSQLPIAILVFGMIVALTIIATFSGAFYEITLPQDYIENFKAYLPV